MLINVFPPTTLMLILGGEHISFLSIQNQLVTPQPSFKTFFPFKLTVFPLVLDCNRFNDTMSNHCIQYTVSVGTSGKQPCLENRGLYALMVLTHIKGALCNFFTGL